jgi:hypothetical protein
VNYYTDHVELSGILNENLKMFVRRKIGDEGVFSVQEARELVGSFRLTDDDFREDIVCLFFTEGTCYVHLRNMLGANSSSMALSRRVSAILSEKNTRAMNLLLHRYIGRFISAVDGDK